MSEPVTQEDFNKIYDQLVETTDAFREAKAACNAVDLGNVDEKLQQLTEKDTVVAEKLQQLTEKDTVVTEKLQQLTEKDTVVTEKLQQLTEKDTVVAEKLQQLTEKDTAVDEKLQQLTEKDTVVAEKLQQLTEKDTVVTEKLQQLTEKDTVVTEKLQQLTEKDASTNISKTHKIPAGDSLLYLPIKKGEVQRWTIDVRSDHAKNNSRASIPLPARYSYSSVHFNGTSTIALVVPNEVLESLYLDTNDGFFEESIVTIDVSLIQNTLKVRMLQSEGDTHTGSTGSEFFAMLGFIDLTDKQIEAGIPVQFKGVAESLLVQERLA